MVLFQLYSIGIIYTLGLILINFDPVKWKNLIFTNVCILELE